MGAVGFGQIHQLANDGHCLLDIDEKALRDRERNRRTVEKNMLLSFLPLVIFSRKIGGTRVGVVRFGQLHRRANDGYCLLDIDKKAPRDRERNWRTVEKSMLLTLLPRLHHRDFFEENRWHAGGISPVWTTPPACH